jgi:predicted transcriptional regulator
MNDKNYPSDLLPYASYILASYITTHVVSLEDLPKELKRVCQVLASVFNNTMSTPGGGLHAKEPAVRVEDSIHDDYIVCLEDGKHLQMLKRHLNTVYGISIEQYKKRWSLPASYPVVSPSYARRRSEIARTIGLGRKGKKNKIKVLQGEETSSGQNQVGVVKV